MNPAQTTIVVFYAAILATSSVSSATNTVITSVAELHTAVSTTATVGVRFEIKAEVAFPYRRRTECFSIFDNTGYTIIQEDRPRRERAANPILAGDRIRISGITRRHRQGGVFAAVKSIQTISKGEPKPPPKIQAADFLSGKFDGRPVRMAGIIRDAFRDEIDPAVLFLILESDGENVYAALRMKESDDGIFRHFVGAEVSLLALCHLETLGFRRLMGRFLGIENVGDIQITKPPATDPFDVPDMLIPSQLRAQEVAVLGRRRATGHVIATWHGGNLLLKTADRQIMRVELAEGRQPRRGQHIEVAGLPTTDLFNVNLTRAIWRPEYEKPLMEEAPTNVTATALMADDQGRTRINTSFHGRTIRLQGIVRSLPAIGNNDGRLYMECEKYRIPVDLSSCPDSLADVSVGCRISVTGVCVMETENWHPNSVFPHVKGFMVVVRTPKDVRIISRPPWWTPKRLMVVIGVLLAALAGIFLWNRSLNRLAERRGRELSEESVAHIAADLKVGERTRLAIELHDALSQNLTGVSLEIATAAKLVSKIGERGMGNGEQGRVEGELSSRNPQRATLHHLDIAARSLKSCRDELRNCIWDLRNCALEAADMNDAVRRTLAPFIDGVDLVVRFNVPRTRLPDDTAHALLRIIRELVQNAIRHGHAKNIKVAGCIEDDLLHFSVADDGDGFDPDNCVGVKQGHFGLQGIRERVNHFGGGMSIESALGAGAKVTISMKI